MPVERWKERQRREELRFWTDSFPAKLDGRDAGRFYRETYHETNAAAFQNLPLAWPGARVLDLGSGPFGSLALHGYDVFIGIDPLAEEYQERFGFPDRWLVLKCMAERLPLRSASVHAVFCINALDHFHAPYEGIEEAIRVLRPGGRLVLSTDVGGTPGHPCRIVEGDLDEALVHSGRFDVVERRCSTELPSTWPVELKIPLFVFQGLKRSSEPEIPVSPPPLGGTPRTRPPP